MRGQQEDEVRRTDERDHEPSRDLCGTDHRAADGVGDDKQQRPDEHRDRHHADAASTYERPCDMRGHQTDKADHPDGRNRHRGEHGRAQQDE